MLVNRNDGTCRECDGTLEIVDVDDISMTVCCMECGGDEYKVEPDAFGDGCVTYYIPLYAHKEEKFKEIHRDSF